MSLHSRGRSRSDGSAHLVAGVGVIHGPSGGAGQGVSICNNGIGGILIAKRSAWACNPRGSIITIGVVAADLGTLAKSRICWRSTPDAEFTRLTMPTPLQRQAFELLGLTTSR